MDKYYSKQNHVLLVAINGLIVTETYWKNEKVLLGLFEDVDVCPADEGRHIEFGRLPKLLNVSGAFRWLNL